MPHAKLPSLTWHYGAIIQSKSRLLFLFHQFKVPPLTTHAGGIKGLQMLPISIRISKSWGLRNQREHSKHGNVVRTESCSLREEGSLTLTACPPFTWGWKLNIIQCHQRRPEVGKWGWGFPHFMVIKGGTSFSGDARGEVRWREQNFKSFYRWSEVKRCLWTFFEVW